MRVFLSRMHFPVTTLGLGRRIGIWFQGCRLRCPGCISADTWDSGLGETTVERLIEAISPWIAEADGITISGGEPFEQVEALEILLQALREELVPGKDVLLYSGRSWEAISDRLKTWDALADVVISDPFDSSAGQSLVWRGSDNQRMHLLTDLGRSLYGEWVQAPRTALAKALDVFFEEDTLWMAGIPDEGSVEAIQKALANAGFTSSSSHAKTGGTAAASFFA